VRLVCISDTHSQHAGLALPEGNVLIHAGDLTGKGTANEVHEALEWSSQVGTFRHRIFCAGNHDFLFEREPQYARSLIPPNVMYLENSGATIEGVKFWGSPITPYFHDWAFNRYASAIGRHWEAIPSDTDVLITHGPPFGVLDRVDGGEPVGCPQLLTEIVNRIRPQVHVFGHIHEGYGVATLRDLSTVFCNASVCDRQYRPTNAPWVMAALSHEGLGHLVHPVHAGSH